jgi:hypothetical protein
MQLNGSFHSLLKQNKLFVMCTKDDGAHTVLQPVIRAVSTAGPCAPTAVTQ